MDMQGRIIELLNFYMYIKVSFILPAISLGIFAINLNPKLLSGKNFV